MMDNLSVVGGKGKTTDNGTHVPLIVNWKGMIKPTELQKLVDFSDFFPTLCEAAGIPLNSDWDLDGVSFFLSCWVKRAEKKMDPYLVQRDGGSNPKSATTNGLETKPIKLYVGKILQYKKDPKRKIDSY